MIFGLDSRCLWCGIFVHSDCKDRVDKICNLGRHATSILPPTALSSINDEQYHQAIFCNQVQNPLLVFINSKSGDNKVRSSTDFGFQILVIIYGSWATHGLMLFLRVSYFCDVFDDILILLKFLILCAMVQQLV